MAYNDRTKMVTKNGHSLFDVSSLLQKAIRRGDEEMAGYAVNELRGRYNNYLWKRLLIISAEDCWGVITKEIVALQQADEIYNKGKKGYDRCGEFISKAVTLLLKARKNRDSDWFACNLIQSEETLNITEYLNLSDEQPKMQKFPDYVYDVHTYEGKRRGKTREDMVNDEQQALYPHQEGDYDNRPWDRFYKAIANPNLNSEKGYPFPDPRDVKEAEDNIGNEKMEQMSLTDLLK